MLALSTFFSHLYVFFATFRSGYLKLWQRPRQYVFFSSNLPFLWISLQNLPSKILIFSETSSNNLPNCYRTVAVCIQGQIFVAEMFPKMLPKMLSVSTQLDARQTRTVWPPPAWIYALLTLRAAYATRRLRASVSPAWVNEHNRRGRPTAVAYLAYEKLSVALNSTLILWSDIR